MAFFMTWALLLIGWGLFNLTAFLCRPEWLKTLTVWQLRCPRCGKLFYFLIFIMLPILIGGGWCSRAYFLLALLWQSERVAIAFSLGLIVLIAGVGYGIYRCRQWKLWRGLLIGSNIALAILIVVLIYRGERDYRTAMQDTREAVGNCETWTKEKRALELADRLKPLTGHNGGMASLAAAFKQATVPMEATTKK